MLLPFTHHRKLRIANAILHGILSMCMLDVYTLSGCHRLQLMGLTLSGIGPTNKTWMVVDLPLWKMWVNSDYCSKYMGKLKKCSKPPGRNIPNSLGCSGTHRPSGPNAIGIRVVNDAIHLKMESLKLKLLDQHSYRKLNKNLTIGLQLPFWLLYICQNTSSYYPIVHHHFINIPSDFVLHLGDKQLKWLTAPTTWT